MERILVNCNEVAGHRKSRCPPRLRRRQVSTSLPWQSQPILGSGKLASRCLNQPEEFQPEPIRMAKTRTIDSKTTSASELPLQIRPPDVRTTLQEILYAAAKS